MAGGSGPQPTVMLRANWRRSWCSIKIAFEVDHAPDVKLLQRCYEEAKDFYAYSGGLGNAKADCAPLEVLSRSWIPKSAIFSMRRVKCQYKIEILKV
jgi:hypothetical protein